jgi:hypothetical protein
VGALALDFVGVETPPPWSRPVSRYDPFDEDLRAELAEKAVNRLQRLLLAAA